jgi:hypothetical protein
MKTLKIEIRLVDNGFLLIVRLGVLGESNNALLISRVYTADKQAQMFEDLEQITLDEIKRR